MIRKKVLFIYYQNIKQGGISKAIANITKNLADNGLDITILFLMTEHEDFFQIDKRVRKIYLDSFDTHYYKAACTLNQKKHLKGRVRKFINYSYDLGSFFVLKAWITENHNEYDQIVSCWYKLSSFLTFTDAKTKVIAWEHINYTTGGLLFFTILRKRYSKLQGVICLTEEALTYYKTINYNSLKIPNVIGDEYENCKPDFTSKENNIFLASRLDPEKNISEFLDIIKLIIFPKNWSIYIAGNGIEYDKLTKKSESLELGNVKFTGSLSSEMMLEYYKKSKIFCMTSLVEGLPTTLIEAMFCGNALISYDCPTGPSEIINSQNGFLIPLNDKQLFREKMEFLVQNPIELNILMESSHKQALKWGKKKIVQKWLNVLNLH